MPQKTALVTGASAGFGTIMTQQLVKDGYYVLATARRMDRLEAMRTESIEPFELDVTNQSHVDQAINHLIETRGHIDLLVNNAGYGYYSTIEEGDIEDVKRQFDVNFLGVMRMTQAVLPHMRKQQSGLIVNISSVVGHFSFPPLGYYASTKHALEAFSDALRIEVEQFGIKVVIVEPGAIQTEFREVALEQFEKSHKLPAYDNFFELAKRYHCKTFSKAPKAEVIAPVIHKIVTSSSPRRRYPVGPTAGLYIFIKNKIGDWLMDWGFKQMMKRG